MTNTIAEAKRLIRAAERKKIKLAIGFVERFNPAVQEAIKLTLDGDNGAPLAFLEGDAAKGDFHPRQYACRI